MWRSVTIFRDENTAWSSWQWGSPDAQHVLFWWSCLGRKMQEYANYCRGKWTYVMFGMQWWKPSSTSEQGAQSSKESLPVGFTRVLLLLNPSRKARGCPHAANPHVVGAEYLLLSKAMTQITFSVTKLLSESKAELWNWQTPISSPMWSSMLCGLNVSWNCSVLCLLMHGLCILNLYMGYNKSSVWI